MKINRKKIIILVIIIFIVSILSIMFNYYNSVTDVENVKVEGHVYDSMTKEPIQNVLVIVNNERYLSDDGFTNYDEYLGHDTIKAYTDENGYYSFDIEKSSFLWIDFQKEGYLSHRIEGRYSTKYIKDKVTLIKR